ncbi:MAG: ParA family protein [Polyangiaceae bacterium]
MAEMMTHVAPATGPKATGLKESCSVCGNAFEMQFRYQMEETKSGFAFYCSQACHARSVRGEDGEGVHCDACGKRFLVELVSQVVRTRTGRSYACTDDCRKIVLGEVSAYAVPPAPTAAPREMHIAHAAPAAPARPATPAHAPTPAPRATAEAAPRTATAMTNTGVPYLGPKHLAIFNHKGGTGKTTTTVSLAAGLAMRGLRVLLVDTDSQGNVGVSLGAKFERSLYHVLVMGIRPQDAAVKIRENLDFVGSNETLAAAELYLAGRQNRDRVLRDRLARVADDYDVVLLDCSPSLSLMNQNALVFADGVLVPVACDFLSLVGVRQVVKTIKNVNALLHHPVQLFGVLPTFYDARAKICREALDTMTEHFGDRCLTPIRAATKIKEAPAQGKTIFEYSPESNAAEDYMRVVDAIIAGNGYTKNEPAAEGAAKQSA